MFRKWFREKIQTVTRVATVAFTTVMVPLWLFAEPVGGLELPSSVDLSALFPFAGAIISALVTLIVIRKGIKLANRS